MGSCAYFLKAAFPTGAIAKKTKKKLTEFFAEARDAYMFWQNNRGDQMTEEEFYIEYEKKFPTMMEYIQSIGAKTREDLSGEVDFGQNEYEVIQIGNVLCYQDCEVWHFSNWTNLTRFIQKKFGAVKVVWNYEDSGCGSLASLQLYEWEQIVTDILKHKELHPLLIGINTELDTLLETTMKKRGKNEKN